MKPYSYQASLMQNHLGPFLWRIQLEIGPGEPSVPPEVHSPSKQSPSKGDLCELRKGTCCSQIQLANLQPLVPRWMGSPLPLHPQRGTGTCQAPCPALLSSKAKAALSF